MKVNYLGEPLVASAKLMTVGSSRAAMAAALLPREKMLELWAQPSVSYAAMAREHHLTPNDVTFLAAYYCLPPRTVKSARSQGVSAAKLDVLAERLFELMEPRLSALVESAATDARVRGIIEAMVREAVEEALR